MPDKNRITELREVLFTMHKHTTLRLEMFKAGHMTLDQAWRYGLASLSYRTIVRHA
jgi:hypothetical protein